MTIAIVALVVAVLISFLLGFVCRKRIAEAKIGGAEKQAEEIKKNATKEAEAAKKEIILEAKEESIKMKNKAEEEAKQLKHEASETEKRLAQKEESLNHRSESLERKEQSLLFLNRRGYAPLVLCRTCGHRIQCPHCSTWLIQHKSNKTLQCHHCGYTMPMPKICPVCNQETLVSCGPGVERVAEEVLSLFPQARIAQITSETIIHPKDFEALMEQIKN